MTDVSRCHDEAIFHRRGRTCPPTERAAYPGRGLRRRPGAARRRSKRLLRAHAKPAASWNRRPRTGGYRTIEPPHHRSARARSSARTSCCSRSAKAAWAWSSWPSRPSRSSGKVALKVIKPGMDTRQVIARFEAERQALAMMDHPNIARCSTPGHDRDRPAVLRHGTGPRRADHRVLRRATT